jgi:hypothetical protein
MQAAAHGDSKIGIPQSIGKEFAAADEAKTHRRKHKMGHQVKSWTEEMMGRVPKED